PLQLSSKPQPRVASWFLRSSLLFRLGELVWYQNATIWRLGIVSASVNDKHEIVPIGHSSVKKKTVFRLDIDIRPFYALSVPPVDAAYLKGEIFDDVPWDIIFQAEQLNGNERESLILDASKMAAAKIDYSYSFWSQISIDAQTVTYYGCFFGAERIEIGDALRLQSISSKSNTPITPTAARFLGLRYIVTFKRFPGRMFFNGDVYQLVKSDTNPFSSKAEEHLPIALKEEINWRNSTNPGEHWHFDLVGRNLVYAEEDISGRFYPTPRLMPIISPDGFWNAVAQGQTDNQYTLNSRKDATVGKCLGKKVNRLDTLGTSVPLSATFTQETYVRE
ncbi:hypothetical protein BGZ61DRAFT_286475, partial [Ilyonectria robusta]|uniref:uncharacterized protein n=1 Tax=Ilyonectria robusta TaxID=1079257 RepID=UPI001E8D68DA